MCMPMFEPRNTLRGTGRRESLANIAFGSSNPLISKIKTKIKSIEANKDKIDISYAIPLDGTVVQFEQVLINRLPVNVRKVYAVDSPYKVGWIADCDVNVCMICFKDFWFGYRRHHCRACGLIVCTNCSPFRVNVPALEPESGGSRVCTDCFGLKSNMTPIYVISGVNQVTPTTSPVDEQRRLSARRSQTTRSMYFTPESDEAISQLDNFEVQQKPVYREAYRSMRRIIAPDITKSTLSIILEDGVPDAIAKRIWNVKALWLICMHEDDIKKIHIADLRGKYDYHDLDLREMQAIWYTLPVWDEAIDVAKAEWREGFKTKLDWMAYRNAKGTLPPDYLRNPVYQAYENLSIYDPDLPIGSRYQRAASATQEASESPEPRQHRIESTTGDDDNEPDHPDLQDLTPMAALFRSNTMKHSPKMLTENEIEDDHQLQGFFAAFQERQSTTAQDLSSDLKMEGDEMLDPESTPAPDMTINVPQETATESEPGNLSPLSLMLENLRKLNREDSMLSPLMLHRQEITSDQSNSPAITPRSPAGDIEIDPNDLKELIKLGQAAKARRFIKKGCPVPSSAEATLLMFQCLDNVDILSEPLGTFAVLIEVCEADVNAFDESGYTPLMRLVKLNNSHLGTYFMSRGANALQLDSLGNCPLSVGLQSGYEWVLHEFQIHQEELVLSSSDTDCIYQYIAYLITAGHGLKAGSILEEKEIELTPEEATNLFKRCHGNFEKMKDPVETFELLSKFGAVVDE